MKNMFLTVGLLAVSYLFCSAGCINNFSSAWNSEQDRFVTAAINCSLLPGGGQGCQNHAAEVHDRNMQKIQDDYNCCEFNECP